MSLILVYILAHFVQYTKATNAIGGIQTAFGCGLASLLLLSYHGPFRGQKLRPFRNQRGISVCRLLAGRGDTRSLAHSGRVGSRCRAGLVSLFQFSQARTERPVP